MAWPECSVDFADNAAATPPGSASTADRITGGVASLDPRLIARTPAGVPGLLFGEMTVIGCPRQKVRCSVSTPPRLILQKNDPNCGTGAGSCWQPLLR